MAQDILVPNIGDFKNVEIIEVLIKEGQEVEKGDAIITLESDKSSVEVPSSSSGKIKKIHIKIGDKVSEGSLIASLEGSEVQAKNKQEEKKIIDNQKISQKTEEIQLNQTIELKTLTIPSINFSGKLIITNILVKTGDKVVPEQPVITLEDNTSSIDIPSPITGIIDKILVQPNQEVSIDQEICKIQTEQKISKIIKETNTRQEPIITTPQSSNEDFSSNVTGASPKVMKFARELGVTIDQINGTGRKGRVLEQDIKRYVSENINKPKASASSPVVTQPEQPKSEAITFSA